MGLRTENSEFWMDRPVFVTGASGLIGGWLVKQRFMALDGL